MVMQDNQGDLRHPAGNVSRTIFPSAARSEEHASPDFDNFNHRGVQLVVDVTAITEDTSPSMTVTIQGKDPASGGYYTLLAGAALSTVGTVLMTVHPSVVAAANVAASHALPRSWRVLVEHTPDGESTMTYSIGANLVL